jgi:hypothetical protein
VKVNFFLTKLDAFFLSSRSEPEPEDVAPLRFYDRCIKMTKLKPAIPTRFHQMQKELRQQPEIILP